LGNEDAHESISSRRAANNEPKEGNDEPALSPVRDPFGALIEIAGWLRAVMSSVGPTPTLVLIRNLDNAIAPKSTNIYVIANLEGY
jgi:hypothetical protein